MTSILERDFLDVSEAGDVESLRARLVEFAARLDFGLVSAVLMRGELNSPTVTGQSVGNTPEAFIAASRSLDNARRDPVMSRLRRGGLPLAYDQRLYVEDDAVDMWDLQAQFGYRCGIAVSCHSPSSNEHFFIGVDRPQALPSNEEKLHRLRSDVRLLAAYAQVAATRLFSKANQGDDASLSLREREIECLRWAVIGKTAKETARHLGITERGVRFHLDNAKAKLGVYTKREAALICLERGIIH